jgi:hypothetical protein
MRAETTRRRAAWISRRYRHDGLARVVTFVVAVIPLAASAQNGVSGAIRYYSNGSPVGAAVVQLEGATPDAVQTHLDGSFAFKGLAGGAWQIEPRKTGATSATPDAVSALDAAYVLQSVVGLRTLNAAQQLACDVTGDGTVSALDAALILQYKVGLITSFPVAQACGSDWAFIPVPAAAANQQLIQPQIAGGACRGGAIAFQPLAGQVSNQDFSAVLFADCTGNWQPAVVPTSTAAPVPTASATPSRPPSSTATATRTPSPTRTATTTPARTATATNTRSPAASATVTTTASPAGPRLGGCTVFPPDNPWNRDVSADPVDPNSANYIASINLGATHLHADFGSPADYGIPYAVVPGMQPMVPITFDEYGDESDPGPYPIPPDAPVEAGSDRHVLVLDSGNCTLYELYHASKDAVGSGWTAGSGATFNLASNALRPDGWTSCDEAGLPILPGLVRYDEVTAGEIRHALRFTVWRTQRAWVHPATHYGTSSNLNDPPMGLRVRLKASFDVSHYSGQARVVLDALRKFGMLVADTGGSWFITGATDARWNDTDLDQLKTVPGSAFEVVQLGTVYRP